MSGARPTWMNANLGVQGYCRGVLVAIGQPTAALILGGILISVCGVVTVTNFCIPSTQPS
jgi:hypothetical protein